MVIKTRLLDQGGSVFIEVLTDNGGDQTYGPFVSVEDAMRHLRAAVENDFDQPFDPTTHETVPFDPLNQD